MGYFPPKLRDYAMHFSSTYSRNGRSRNAVHSGAYCWISQVTQEEWFLVGRNEVPGQEHQGDRIHLGALGEVCRLSLKTPHCNLVRKNYEKLRQNQGDLVGASLFSRSVDPCSSLVHLKMNQSVSRGCSAVHTSSFGMHTDVENCASQVSSAPCDGLQESTAKQPPMFNETVKTITDILSRRGWETALSQHKVHLTEQLVGDVIKRHSNVVVVFAFFRWVQDEGGFQHTARTYKAMLYKLMSHQSFKTRDLDTFRLVLDESLQHGWSPGVTIHTYLIDGYCKVGKLDEALDHFRMMTNHDCAPNVITYSILISGLVRAGKIDKALGMLDEMEAEECLPNVVTYSSVIHGLVKSKRLEEACTLFAKMKEQGCTPNLITYSCLIDGVAKAEKLEEVLNLLDEMRATGCTPNIFIYGTSINYFVKIGKLQKAWDLFADMKSHGLVPNLFIFTPLMASLGKTGDWERAQQLLAEMKARQCAPDVITYSALISGLLRAGKWEEGCRVVDEMEANRCEPNEVTYAVLIDGLIKAKQAEKAEAFFRQMVARGCTPRQQHLRRVLDKAAAQ